MKRCPPGLIGAIFGALGALPLLPLAAALAIRFSSLPTLPGAERAGRDFKQATYAEAAVLLVVVPLAALLFGSILPRFLESRAAAGALSFEWVAVGFGSSFFLAQRGLSPAAALTVGSSAAAAIAAGILVFRRSFRVRRLFGRRGRRDAGLLMLAGSSLELARRAGLAPARFVLADRLSDVLLAGLALPVLMALACLWLSRRPGVAFSRLGGIAWIPIGAAALTISWPAISPWLLWVGLLLMPVAALFFSVPVGSAGLERAAFIALFLACAWRVVHAPVVRIDALEDGHSLFATQLYARGARPYVDVAPIHGWGADGGVDSLCFRLFGATLETYIIRCSVWAAGAMLLLGTTCVVTLGPLWGAFAVLLCLSIGPVPIERQMLAVAALSVLCWGVRKRRPVALAVAGALAGWEVLYSLDYGLFIVVGGLGALLLLPVLELRSPDREVSIALSGLRNFALGLTVGILPFLIALAIEGSLVGFFRTSFIEIPHWVEEVWGIPVGSFWDALRSAKTAGGLVSQLSGQSLPPLFLLLLLAIAGAVFLLRSARGEFDADDRAAWVAFVVAALAMRAVLGRADALHYARYGIFVGVPAAWLLMRAWRGGRAGEFLFIPALLLVFARLHPFHTLDFELQSVENAARLAASTQASPAPRSGGAMILADQAATLTWFRQFTDTHLSPGETFFDFNNSPALYFFADRTPPIRYCNVAQYESEERQREVIAALEKSKPPLVLLPQSALDFDGVSNADRAPEVFRFLTQNYEPDPEVRQIAWRKGARRSLDGP
jgi:hypothetical protein